MTPAYLHEKLIEACENGNLEGVKDSLDAGADPNFNIQRQSNALNLAIESDNLQIITLLLDHGALVKELVLQKAIEKDKNYLPLLIPEFTTCKDEKLLMGVLQAAIHTGDFDLASRAIDQGANPKKLFLSAIRDLHDTEILQLLIENGFNLHVEKNKIVTEWMGSSPVGGWRNSKAPKHNLLEFISCYYLEKPDLIENFSTLGEKTLLFRIGLDINNFNIMKFAFIIGANKNEALNSSLYRYHAKNNNKSNAHRVDYEIIEYILNSDIKFDKITISNAVCFKYNEILDALSDSHDLEYGYEMAYNYENNELCEYFIGRGVSKEAQNLAKMKISAIKGDIKELRNAVNNGARLEELDKEIIVEIINNNKADTLRYFGDSGFIFDSSFNQYLNHAMAYHEAYETVSYLIELGLDITRIKNMPRSYKKKYPVLADMWEKRFPDIFDYTVHLASEVYPKLEGKEKEEALKSVAALSSLPYIVKKSEEKSLD